MTNITSLEGYFCPPDISIREALARLNATDHVFQLVVRSDRLLMGTLTDGDVRRALLRGVSLDAPVHESMHQNFLAGRVGEDGDNRSLLAKDTRLVTFLPILNPQGEVVEVLVHGRDAGIERALIMAGGFGRRLGDQTRETPKPLLPVGGRPILDHVLANLENSGVRDVYVSVHYHADQIRRFIETRANRTRIGMIEESQPLGTAGALGHIDFEGQAPILVINGDVITSVDLVALHDFHVGDALDATIGVARYDVEVPFGVVRSGADGLFAGIDEKPRISNFVAAGVYYLSAQIAALVEKDRPLDMPDLLNQSKDRGLKIGIFPIHEYWTDVGSPADLEAAVAVHQDSTNADK
jgi:dTDP-glucose pyrophosphorylase